MFCDNCLFQNVLWEKPSNPLQQTGVLFSCGLPSEDKPQVGSSVAPSPGACAGLPCLPEPAPEHIALTLLPGQELAAFPLPARHAAPSQRTGM